MLTTHQNGLSRALQAARTDFFFAGGAPEQFDRLDLLGRGHRLAARRAGAGREPTRAEVRQAMRDLMRGATHAVRRGTVAEFLDRLEVAEEAPTPRR
jgi:hypothetical protein